MRMVIDHLTVGERVAWYRRRRGMSQEVLAGLVGRTADWLQKAERNRIELDRLSVIRELAHALSLSLAHLLDEPVSIARTRSSTRQGISALSATLMNYRGITAIPAGRFDGEPPTVECVKGNLETVWSA